MVSEGMGVGFDGGCVIRWDTMMVCAGMFW